MNIAFYLGHYPHPSGTSQAVSGLAQGLDRIGHQVTILALGSEELKYRERGVKIRIFQSSGSAAFQRSTRSVGSFLSNPRNKIDLLILCGMFQPELVPLQKTARSAGIGVIIAPHGPYHPEMFRKHRVKKEVYWTLFERKLLSRSKAIQQLSRSDVRQLRRRGLNTPQVIVPNGCYPAARSAEVVNDPIGTYVRIGFLGRLDAWTKGLDILIRGFAIASAKEPRLRLTIQGPDWGDKMALQRLAARTKMIDAIEFVDPAYGLSQTLISNWHALILPSRYEGFGIVGIEAMLAQRPVICSSQAGIAEHVSCAGSGLIVDPSVKSIADGLLSFAHNLSHWLTLGKLGREYAVRELNWDKIADDASNCYASFLGGAS